MRHFLSLTDFSRQDIQGLVDFARHLKQNPLGDALHRKVIGLLFMNPSLRTLASFQSAVAQQGGSAFVIQPGSSSWTLEFSDGTVMDGTAVEHIREAIPVLNSYCDVLGIRAFAKQESLEDELSDHEIKKMAALCQKPMINMESACDHPCQALADWMTMDELEISSNGHFVLSWAWHPKPLPYAVPRAALNMAAQRGMHISVHCPPGFEFPKPMVDEANALGAKSLRFSHERSLALQDAHVLYCKSWCAPQYYGNPQEELKYRESFRDWCVREDWFESAKPDAKFMHCLPIRRNVKAADEVLDGPRSVVQQQAENRLHGQKAVLLSMLQELGPWK